MFIELISICSFGFVYRICYAVAHASLCACSSQAIQSARFFVPLGYILTYSRERGAKRDGGKERDSPSCGSLKLILGSGLPAVFSQHSVLSPGNPLHHTQQRRQHLCCQRCRRWYLANLPGQLNVRQCVSQIQDGPQYLSAAAAQSWGERERE